MHLLIRSQAWLPSFVCSPLEDQFYLQDNKIFKIAFLNTPNSQNFFKSCSSFKQVDFSDKNSDLISEITRQLETKSHIS